jgi:ketosteroid isomerase-like protein
LRKTLTLGVLAALLALVYVAGGCAMLKRGPSDKDLLSELLKAYETALVEGDADKLISLYSEDYESLDGTDYEEAMTRLRRIVPMFEEWSIEVGTAETQISVEGDTATLSPVILDTPRGEMTLTMFAAKEAGGVWRIIGSETESPR